MNVNCSETYATLRIVGSSADPDLLTQIMGVEPTFTVQVGQITPPGTSARHEGIWALSSRDRIQSHDLSEHIELLLGDLRVNIRDVVPADCRSEIQCYWRSATGHGGPHLPSQLLARLAELGLSLDFDFYSDA